MSCIRLSRRPLRPFGLRCALPLFLAFAGLGSACSDDGIHTHQVELEADNLVVRAVVEQRSDVRVDLVDSDGREIVHVDGPHGTRENEELVAVVERAGTYHLRVHLCPQGEPADKCYSLKIDPPRPATEADRRRAEAVRATQAAVDAMAQGDIDAQLAAREQALALWNGLGDRRREAEELYQLGALHLLKREYEPAARRLHRSAEIWAALGDTDREAAALNDAGRACEWTGHTEDASRDYRLALAKAKQSGNRELQGHSLNNLGLLLNSLGARQEALRHLKEALSCAQETKDEASQANILNSLGTTYDDLGEPQRAIQHYKQSLGVPQARLHDRAAAYNNLGAVHTALGNWEEAAENFNKAIALNRKENDPYSLASTLNNLGRAQHYAGEVDAARASYEEALALARETGNRQTEILAASNYGFLLHDKLGQPAKARTQWQEVARLAADHPMLDYVGLNARAMVELGEKRYDQARATLQEGIALTQRKAELRFAADLTLQLARMERSLGNLQVAAEHARTAIESIESLRNRVVTPDQRALFLASRQSFYTTYIDILMGLGEDTRAFEVSEQARARGLLDLLAEARADLRKDVPPQLLERERQLRASLRESDLRHMELIHRGAPAQEIALAARRLSEALDEAEELESTLRAGSASYAALTQPRLLSVREIQQQILNDRTLLLEYSLGEERSYLWALTASTFQSFELPGRKEIETAALGFYDAVTVRNEPEGKLTGEQIAARNQQADARAERASRALSRAILGPVEPLLGDRILLVIGDGVLHYVPFAALPLPSNPQERVLARNQVVSLPSASTLAALRRQIEGRAPAPKLVAVLADPVFQGDPRLARFGKARQSEDRVASTRGLPPRSAGEPSDQLSLERLPFSDEEARHILGLVPEPGQRLDARGFAALSSTATSGQLAQYRYVHFATHGLIDSRQPKLSKLALSQFDVTGRQQDPFLRLSDIYNLDLNADLVALSACKTALGKEVQGEGLVGLTRGFMYAGSPRVLASLWSVEDRATAQLMKSFYRHLLTERRPAAEALRLAQLEVARDPQTRSPYYWAGFSLQGEWK